MSNLRLIKLEKLIAKGKWHYILVYGVMGWGVPTAVLVSVIEQYFFEKLFVDQIGIALVIYPIAGIGFGLFMWFFIKKQYNKLRSQSKDL